MNISKGIPCQSHYQECITNYCKDCYKALCPECLHTHNQMHKDKQHFPDIESLKKIITQSNDKVMQFNLQISNQFRIMEDRSHLFQVKHSASIMALQQIKGQMITIIEHHFKLYEQSLNDNMKDIQSKFVLTPLVEKIKAIQLEINHSINSISTQDKDCLINLQKILKYDHQQLQQLYFNQINGLLDDITLTQKNITFDDFVPKMQQFQRSLEFILEDVLEPPQLKQSNHSVKLVKEFTEYSATKANQSISNKENLSNTKVKQPQYVITDQSARQKLQFDSVQQLELSAEDSFNTKSQRKFLHYFQSESNILHFLDLKQDKYEFKQIEIKNIQTVANFHSSLATPDGDIYLLGGSYSNNQKTGLAYKFDFIRNTLLPVSQMNYPRSSFGSCLVQGYIYVVGGFLQGNEITNKCERMNMRGEWEVIESLCDTCSSMSVCQFGSQYIYKFGGINEQFQLSNTIERYEIQSNQWQKIKPQLHGNIQLNSMSSCIQINSKQILILGGYDDNNEGQNSVVVFTDQHNGNHQLQESDCYLPQKEAFWNQQIIVDQGKLYGLQNISGENESSCLQDDRIIIQFNGKWQIL